jgi:hypothetical protein
MERWAEGFNTCAGGGRVAEKMDGSFALLYIESILWHLEMH